MRARFALACAAGLFLGTESGAHGTHDEQAGETSARIAGEPREARHYLARAELFRHQGRLREAEADLAQATRLDPSLPAIALGRSALALDGRDPRHALRILDSLSLRLECPPEAHILMARALHDLGRAGEAASSMDRAIATIARPTPDHYLERASLLTAVGETSRAVLGLDEGIARLGPAPALIDRAIELDLASGRFDSALARHASLRPAGRQEAWLARQGELLAAAGRSLEATAAFTEALRALDELSAQRRAAPATLALEKRLRSALEVRPR